MSIINTIYMRNRQAGGGAPNSPAIPLPTAIQGFKFRCRQTGQIVPKMLIQRGFLTMLRCISGAEKCFSLL